MKIAIGKTVFLTKPIGISDTDAPERIGSRIATIGSIINTGIYIVATREIGTRGRRAGKSNIAVGEIDLGQAYSIDKILDHIETGYR